MNKILSSKTAKFFVSALFLCGAISLIDASFNPVHALGGVKPTKNIK